MSDYAEIKLRGIACHVTQVGRDSACSYPTAEMLRPPLLQAEHFVLIHSTVGWPEEPERDLFAGLR